MAQHLTLLTLAQFRSHGRTRLAFDGRPVAIWGPNGAGKTNILEAISLLSPGRGLRAAPPEALARQPGALGWKLTAELAGRAVASWAEPGRPRQVSLEDKPCPQAALGRVARMLWLTPAMDRLWIEGAEGRRRFLDRMALSFRPGHAEAALAYDKAMRERNRLLRDGVEDARWYAALEAQMARAGAEVAVNRAHALARLAAATEDGPFPVATLSLSGPDGLPAPDEAGALARALAEGRRRDMAAGRSLTGPHRTDLRAVYAAKGLPAEQCSTGEQKALLISLVLANARALRAEEGAAPILLLDEVAAHLDDSRRAALYGALEGLGAQVFLTGTGPELFAGLAGRAQGLAVAERDGQSQVTEAEVL
ncbi:MAG: DNA replication/repair protein RecF [Alkalilacustris sp.]